MPFPSSATTRIGAQPRLRGGIQQRTLAGTLTLDRQSPLWLLLDPGGAHRDVVLPAIADADGLVVHLYNNQADAENLVVKEAAGDGGSTIVTLGANEGAFIGLADTDADNIGDAWAVFGRTNA